MSSCCILLNLWLVYSCNAWKKKQFKLCLARWIKRHIFRQWEGARYVMMFAARVSWTRKCHLHNSIHVRFVCTHPDTRKALLFEQEITSFLHIAGPWMPFEVGNIRTMALADGLRILGKRRPSLRSDFCIELEKLWDPGRLPSSFCGNDSSVVSFWNHTEFIQTCLYRMLCNLPCTEAKTKWFGYQLSSIQTTSNYHHVSRLFHLMLGTSKIQW